METKFESSSSLGNLTIKGFFLEEKENFFKRERHIVKVGRGRQSVRERLGSQRFRKSYVSHYSRVLIMYIMCKQKGKNQNIILEASCD